VQTPLGRELASRHFFGRKSAVLEVRRFLGCGHNQIPASRPPQFLPKFHVDRSNLLEAGRTDGCVETPATMKKLNRNLSKLDSQEPPGFHNGAGIAISQRLCLQYRPRSPVSLARYGHHPGQNYAGENRRR
jgi:hypothetical protein